MSVGIDNDDGETPGYEHLLALRQLRRDLERVAAPQSPEDEYVEVTSDELRRELNELIAALDRRAPHLDRVGEAAIAHDAASLRRRALARLAELDADVQSRVRGE
jgi:hypothetical protein